MREIYILTCGLNLNLTSGVMLIIFFGLPLRPYVAVGRRGLLGFRLKCSDQFVGSERKVPIKVQIKVPINYLTLTLPINFTLPD